jgi:hypothetical protein
MQRKEGLGETGNHEGKWIGQMGRGNWCDGIGRDQRALVFAPVAT